MAHLSVIQMFAIWAVPVLFAITIHEVAHGWMALRLGDRTAMMLGRLTINPIKHIDPVGTLLVPTITLMLGGFIFGWAKPVPVTWENLKKPKRDMTLVALAGPLANLTMAGLWIAVMKLGLWLGNTSAWFGDPLVYMGAAGTIINTLLMVLNLVPLPPLDGGRVMTGLLPGPLAWKYSRLEAYGFLIIVILIATNVLGRVLWPIIVSVVAMLCSVANIPLPLFEMVLNAIMP